MHRYDILHIFEALRRVFQRLQEERLGHMSKKQKKQRQADGIWISDERRITNECRQVYPALYQLQRTVLIITAIVWIIELVSPTILKNTVASYAAWGGTYETVMLIAAIVMLVVYIIANYFWQEKMKKFREKYEKAQLKRKKKS